MANLRSQCIPLPVGSRPTGPASHHGLIDGVGGLIREDTGGQAGHHFAHTPLESCMEDVVIDVYVLPLWVAGVSEAALGRTLTCISRDRYGTYLGLSGLGTT